MSDNAAYDVRLQKEKEIKQLLEDNRELIIEKLLLKKRIRELENQLKKNHEPHPTQNPSA